MSSSSNQQTSALPATKRATTNFECRADKKEKLNTGRTQPVLLVTARFTWESKSNTLQSDALSGLTYHGCSALNSNALKKNSRDIRNGSGFDGDPSVRGESLCATLPPEGLPGVLALIRLDREGVWTVMWHVGVAITIYLSI